MVATRSSEFTGKTTAIKTTAELRKPSNQQEHEGSPRTVMWHHLPSWQQDNQYILSGYRPASGSYRKSFASLSHLHNESVNIFSHLIGAMLFAIGSVGLYSALKLRYEEASWQDIYAFSCFFLGAILCLSMSATYHATLNHSPAVAKLGNKLDYLGIVFLIWGSFIPSIYYGFACDHRLMNSYWAMITTIGIGCAVVSTDSKFRTPQWRPFRASMFCAMGLSAIAPVIHGLKIYGLEQMIKLIGLPWLTSQGAMYVLGAVLYAARVPERLKPGQFDIWGSSHQIFHCLVVMAAATHLYGLLKAFDYHHTAARVVFCARS